MGMFDDLVCEVPLPDGYHGDFQTKDFDCGLDNYAIRSNGRLEVLRYELVKDLEAAADKVWPYKRANEHWEPVEFHGVIRFYGYDRDGLPPLAPHDPSRWHEYEAKFTDGRLISIELKDQPSAS